MSRSQRAGLGWRSLAVGLGILGITGIGLASAWSPVAADDRSSPGSGAYPAAYAIAGAKVVAAPGTVFDPGTIVVRRGVIEPIVTWHWAYSSQPPLTSGNIAFPAISAFDIRSAWAAASLNRSAMFGSAGS